MPTFSNSSKSNLETCDKKIQDILNEAISIIDFSVVEGHRSRMRQQELYAEGKTKLDGVKKLSKHQSYPSQAVDIYPWPREADPDKDKARFYEMMGVVKAVAHKQGVKVRFGMDWDSDGTFSDQSFDDLPHFELT